MHGTHTYTRVHVRTSTQGDTGSSCDCPELRATCADHVDTKAAANVSASLLPSEREAEAEMKVGHLQQRALLKDGGGLGLGLRTVPQPLALVLHAYGAQGSSRWQPPEPGATASSHPHPCLRQPFFMAWTLSLQGPPADWEKDPWGSSPAPIFQYWHHQEGNRTNLLLQSCPDGPPHL
jgi:hypothetical protein